jgi:hypothetical protein
MPLQRWKKESIKPSHTRVCVRALAYIWPTWTLEMGPSVFWLRQYYRLYSLCLCVSIRVWIQVTYTCGLRFKKKRLQLRYLCLPLPIGDVRARDKVQKCESTYAQREELVTHSHPIGHAWLGSTYRCTMHGSWMHVKIGHTSRPAIRLSFLGKVFELTKITG